MRVWTGSRWEPEPVEFLNTFPTWTPVDAADGRAVIAGWEPGGTVTATRTQFGAGVSLSGRNAACLAANDKVYAPNAAGEDVLIVDIRNGTAVLIATDNAFRGGWYGVVLAPNNMAYGIPYNADDILRIDTNADTWTRSTMGASLGTEVDSKWYGGIYSTVSGLIYGVPASATDVLMIDPVAGTADRDDLGVGGWPPNGYHGCVELADGRIFLAPGSATVIRIIDPSDNSVDTVTIPGTATGSGKWRGAAVAPDGRVFCCPSEATDVLIYDPDTNTASRTDYGLTLPGGSAWWGMQTGTDGRLYCTPRNTDSILVIDPVNNTASLETFGLDLSSPASNRWAGGGTLTRDGRLVMVPFAADDCLVIDTNGTGGGTRDLFLSGVLNVY